jgi:hypothetical protein
MFWRYHVTRCVEGKAVFVHAIMACGGMKGQLQSFLTSAQDGDKWSISRPGHFLRENVPAPVKIGEWVGARADLDALEKRKTACTGRESNYGCSFPARNLVPIRTELSALSKLENS